MSLLDAGEVYFIFFEYGGKFSKAVVVYAVRINCSYLEPVVAKVHGEWLRKGAVCGNKIFSLDFVYGFFYNVFFLGVGKSIVFVKFCNNSLAGGSY